MVVPANVRNHWPDPAHRVSFTEIVGDTELVVGIYGDQDIWTGEVLMGNVATCKQRNRKGGDTN